MSVVTLESITRTASAIAVGSFLIVVVGDLVWSSDNVSLGPLFLLIPLSFALALVSVICSLTSYRRGSFRTRKWLVTSSVVCILCLAAFGLWEFGSGFGGLSAL
jgi:hypothetical protein